ncbi:hypothetical protein D3C86_1889380 [compost metagenome]
MIGWNGTRVDADVGHQWAFYRREVLDHALSGWCEAAIESDHHLAFARATVSRVDFTQLLHRQGQWFFHIHMFAGIQGIAYRRPMSVVAGSDDDGIRIALQQLGITASTKGKAELCGDTLG